MKEVKDLKAKRDQAQYKAAKEFNALMEFDNLKGNYATSSYDFIEFKIRSDSTEISWFKHAWAYI